MAKKLRLQDQASPIRRVLGDRLIDAQGGVWRRVGQGWLVPDEVEAHITRGAALVIVDGRPETLFDADKILSAWKSRRAFIEAPENSGAEADVDGKKWLATAWRLEGERRAVLVALTAVC